AKHREGRRTPETVAEQRMELQPGVGGGWCKCEKVGNHRCASRLGGARCEYNIGFGDRDGGNRQLRQWRPRRSHGLRLRANQSAGSGCMTAGTWHSALQLRFVRSFGMLQPAPHLCVTSVSEAVRQLTSGAARSMRA